MKPLKEIKKTFMHLNITQQIAVGILVLFVPLSVALGVSAFSASLGVPVSSISTVQPVQSMPKIPVKNSSSETSSAETSSLETQSKAPVVVSLKPTSFEEDLRVEIVDLKGNLVTGPEFKLTVTAKDKSYNKTWTVNDGYLHLTKLKGGEYTVAIQDMQGYEIPVKQFNCHVEEKVKLEKVDVSDKIKDETQIDASKEDASMTKPRPTPAPTPKLPEFKDTAATTETIIKEYKYKATISTGDFAEENVGYILNADGSKSDYIAKIDKDGYVVGDIRKMSTVKTVSFTLDGQNGKARMVNLKGVNSYGIALLGIDNTGTENSPTDSSTSTSTDSSTSTSTDSSTSTSTDSSTSTSTDSSTSTSTDSSTSTSTDSSTSTSTDSSTSTSTDSSTSTSTDSSTSTPTPAKPSYEKDTVKATEIYASEKGELKPELLTSLKVTDAAVKETVIKNGWSADKKSYYDANGSKVKGQVKIGGVVYNFDSSGNVISSNSIAKGIDISKYQRNIDWQAVKNSGVEYVIIRAGYRGYGTGALVEDPLFKSHIQGASSVGLKIGIYFFTQAITPKEAIEEASMVLQLIKGYNITYPIYFDTEFVGSGARADNMSKFDRTVIARNFCEIIKQGGYKAGVYASKSWFYNQLLYEDISKYDIWVAHYTSATDFRHRYDMWQYTGSGSCPGIPGAVDLNWAYKRY